MTATTRPETLADLVLRVARECQFASAATCERSEKSEKRPDHSTPGGLISHISPFSRPAPAGTADAWTADHDERAAVREYDARAARAWAEALARLDHATPPGDVPPRRWLQFIDDAGRFAEQWGVEAIRLGWEPQDLFGCDRHKPFARIDLAGLVWLLDGCRIESLRPDTAVIEMPSGVLQIYRRRERLPGEVTLAWELVSPGELKPVA